MKTTFSLLAASVLILPLSAQESGPGTDLIDLFEKSQREGATDETLRQLLENKALLELKGPEFRELAPDRQREQLEKQLRDDIKGGAFHPQTWFIGLGVESVDSFIREHLGLEKDAGVKVIQVVPGSPAARAGIQTNDIVFKAAGQKVSSLEGLKQAVEQAGKEDRPLRLEWIHQGTRKDAEIRPEGVPGRNPLNSSPDAGNTGRDLPSPQAPNEMPFQPKLDPETLPLLPAPPPHFKLEALPAPENEAERAWKLLGREMRQGERKEKAPAENPQEGPRWVIGVTVEPIDPMIRSHFELPDGTGVRVESVLRGGPAAEAGLKVNDLIVAANKQQIGSLEALKNVVEKVGSDGKQVHLEVIRRGSRDVVKVEPRDSKAVAEKSEGREGNPSPGFMKQMNRLFEMQQQEIDRLYRQVEELRRQIEKLEKREER